MSFFYNHFGDYMKIYLDVIFLINFLFDFFLLMITSILLRRKVKLKNIILGSLIGALSIFVLFININSFELFIIKIIISLIMVLITFKYKNIRYTLKNMVYLYFTSMILGGVLYYLNVEFSYKQEGLVFYHDGLSINFVFLIIFSPVIVYAYTKQIKELRNNYNNYYNCKIYFNDNYIEVTGFIDSGNKLVDPYLRRPIILINKKDYIYDINEFKMILVPYQGVNSGGMLECITPTKIIINDKELKKKCLVGLLNDEIVIDGVSCILNNKIMEDIIC